LGRGMGFFVPNLSGWRATCAGVCGGLLGGAAFLVLSSLTESAGRFAGAAILGLAIGLMVALVEQLFRQAWLEINYGGGERRTVNLGPDAIRLGSHPRTSTVYVAGAAPLAFRYWFRQGHVTRENASTGKSEEMRFGDAHE